MHGLHLVVVSEVDTQSFLGFCKLNTFEACELLFLAIIIDKPSLWACLMLSRD